MMKASLQYTYMHRYIIYQDVNNLFGWKIIQYLSTSRVKPPMQNKVNAFFVKVTEIDCVKRIIYEKLVVNLQKSYMTSIKNVSISLKKISCQITAYKN